MEGKKAVMTEVEAALYIGMSRSFLAQTRMEGNRQNRTPGPVFVRLGRSIRYRVVDLDRWLEANQVSG